MEKKKVIFKMRKDNLCIIVVITLLILVFYFSFVTSATPIPEQLFDIKLELEHQERAPYTFNSFIRWVVSLFGLKEKITYEPELSALIKLESFGTEPTPINLTFIILDEAENEIHREEERITVETERVLRKSFKELNLDEGRYTIILQTLYGDNVMDEFREEFEVKKKINLFFVGIFLLGLILIIYLIFRFVKSTDKKRGKEGKNEKRW